jgi:hypothetical protein
VASEVIVRNTPGGDPRDWDNWISVSLWKPHLVLARFANRELRNVVVDLTDEQVAHIRAWIMEGEDE